MNKQAKFALHMASVLLAVCASQQALSYSLTLDSVTLDFNVDGNGNEIVHGQVIDNEYANLGVQIWAENNGGGPDLAVGYSSTGSGRDSDLEVGGDNRFDGGNARNTNAGNLLIIQENNHGCSTGVCSKPDDEGSRPAGAIYIGFDEAIESTSFDLVDVEQVERTGASLSLLDQNSNVISGSEITFESLEGQDGITFADNFYNSIQTIFFGALNLTSEVFGLKFDLGGSGAINNVTANYAGVTGANDPTSVPEFDGSTAPITLALLGGLMAIRREKQRRK